MIFRSLRECRLQAARILFKWIGEVKTKAQIRDEAMLLLAALVWLVNGLHSRPDDRNHARNLVTAALPHLSRAVIDETVVLWPTKANNDDEGPRDDDDDDNDDGPPSSTVPCASYGLVFFCNMRIPPAVPIPRLEVSPWRLSDEAFLFFFKKDPETMRRQIQPIGIINPEDLPATRIGGNRKKITPRCMEDEHIEPRTNLAQQGFQLVAWTKDDGSDLEDAFDQQPEVLHPDLRLAKIINQFWKDLVVKSPNPKSPMEPSYLKLSREERMETDCDLFKRKDIPQLFTCFYYRRAAEKDWSEAFNRLFPQKNHQLAGKSIQHYKSCTYYRDWKALIALQNQETVNAMRFGLKKEIYKLNWLPEPSVDRIWTSKRPRSDKYRVFPPDHTGPAPIILIKFDPIWAEAQGGLLGKQTFHLCNIVLSSQKAGSVIRNTLRQH